MEALETMKLVEGETAKMTRIWTTLSLDIKMILVQFLKENLYVFT